MNFILVSFPIRNFLQSLKLEEGCIFRRALHAGGLRRTSDLEAGELDPVVAPRNAFRQIAEQLRRLIRDGVSEPGAMVPSELTLVTQHGVARGTVRSALTRPVQEGFIEVVPGQGWRVVGETGQREPSTAYQQIAADL